MKRFLVLVFVIDCLVSLAIYYYPDKPQISRSLPIDTSLYIASKGYTNSTPKRTFGTLLTSLPLGVIKTVAGTERASFSTTQTITDTLSVFLPKNEYTIAVVGDSMIDTLGPEIPDLKVELARLLPTKSFHILNYGAGATDAENGLKRLTQGYTYLGEAKSAVLSVHPDIVVIESFAYNHWGNTPADRDRQWLTLAKMVETVKSESPQTSVVIAATIAPYCSTYTDGSANLPPERKQSECATVKKYLENAVEFAKSQNLPLADVYHPSLIEQEGNPRYINQGDHIHPSEEGRHFFAKILATTLIRVIH
ncbi:SGNH/GDSL hydrolase family protein [Candidatus Gottesmanbacteria bacterium]|nr:SGNH/GDSL hydrolase family protein [Candidatus Gottesmanbacteria bacterium]